MSSFKKQKMSMAFVILFQAFFVLVSCATDVRADGAEPFSGTIEMIEPGMIKVKVTNQSLTTLAAGEVVAVLITKDTRLVKRIGNSLTDVPFKRLTVGSLVKIKPREITRKVVKADNVRIIRGAR